MAKYTSKQKMAVIGSLMAGETQKACHELHGVSKPTIRVWSRDGDLLRAWASGMEKAGQPLPSRYKPFLARADKVVLDTHKASDKPLTWPQWGHEIAVHAALNLPVTTTKLIHPDKITTLLQSFAIGCPAWACWHCIGQSLENIDPWKKMAAEGKEPYVSLFAAIEAAKALGLVALQGGMLDKPKEFKSSAWLLERRYREDYHLKTEVDQTVMTRSLEDLPEAELDSLIAEG